MSPLSGLPVYTDANLTETKFVQYRRDRFIEYEPTDSPMLREGWTEFRQVPSMNYYILRLPGQPTRIVMHPDILEIIKQPVPNVLPNKT